MDSCGAFATRDLGEILAQEGEAITGHCAVGFASRATTSSVVHSALAM